MKRLLSLILAFAMVLTMVPTAVLAAEPETLPEETVETTVPETEVPQTTAHVTEPEETLPLVTALATEPALQEAAEFTYSLSGDNATITGYTGTDTVVTVPEQLDGHPVTAIGAGAFRGCAALESVTLPASLKYIRDYAFADTGLTVLELPEGLLELGSRALAGNTQVTELIIPSTLTRGENTYNWGALEGSSIQKLVFAEGMTKIPDHTAKNMASLTEVVLPSTLTEIGQEAFSGCASLEAIAIPAGVVTLGNAAFQNCTALKDVTLPDGLKTIGGNAFRGCSALETIALPGSLESIWDYAFAGTGLKSLTLPEGLKTLGSRALAGNTQVTELIIPSTLTRGENTYNWGALEGSSIQKLIFAEGMTKIPDRTAKNMASLTEVVLPSTLTEIGQEAFSGCASLETIAIPAGVVTLGNAAFQNCTALKDVTLPDGLKTIGGNAFRGCSALETIALPVSLEAIWDYAFAGTGLKSLTLPEGLKTLGSRALSGNTQITELTIPSTLTRGENTYTWGALEESSVQKLIFAEGMTKIPSHIAKNIPKLTDVVLPSTLTEIGEQAFTGCVTLEIIEIPAGVITLGANAFQNCTALKDVILPDGLKTIGGNAFRGCSALETIALPGSLESIWDYAFGGTGLKSLTLPEGLKNLGSRVLSGNTQITELTIPSTVARGENAYTWGALEESSVQKLIFAEGMTKIPNHTAKNMASLTEVVLPSTLTEIGEQAFTGCATLEIIEIPAGVITLGANAFQNCTALKDVTLPDGLKTIGGNAFRGCSALETIALPVSLEAIWDYAFAGTGLKSLTLPEGLKTLGSRVLSGNTLITELTIPSTIARGENAYTWGALEESSVQKLIFAEGMTKIPNHTAKNMASLTEVVLPSTLTEIGEQAFTGCATLEIIEIPAGVITLGANAFQNCTALKAVTLPDGLKTIGGNAFRGCSALETIALPGSLEAIWDYAFGGTGLKSLTLPEGLKNLGSRVLSGNTLITELTIPSTVLRGENAYTWGALEESSVQKLIFAEGMTTVPAHIAKNAAALTEVILPDSLTAIGDYAFQNCPNLLTLDIPRNVSAFGKDCLMANDSIRYRCYFNSASLRYLLDHDIPVEVMGRDENRVDYVLDPGTTSLTADMKDLSTTGFVTMTLRYSVKDSWKDSVLPASVTVLIPSNSELRAGTVKVDGTVAPYAEDSGLITVPVTALSGTVTLEIQVTKAGILSGYGLLCYSVGEKEGWSMIGLLSDVDNESTDTKRPTAVITSGENLTAVDMEYQFSGAASQDNVGIASYLWDFGDGSTGSGIAPTHSYGAEGVYSVSLTVVDAAGNSDRDVITLQVVDVGEGSEYALATFKTVNSETGAPVSGATIAVYTSAKSEEEGKLVVSLRSGKDGTAQAILKNASYSVSVVASGFMARTLDVPVTGTKTYTLNMNKSSMVVGSLTAKEMTLEEIKNAGIDLEAEENTHTYSFATVFSFTVGLETFDIPAVVGYKSVPKDGESGVGDAPFERHGTYTPNKPQWHACRTVTGDVNIGIIPLMTEGFYLVIYGQAHWLKEMYNVELVVMNNSSVETMADCTAKLNLPQGLSLAAMVDTPQRAKIDLGTLAPKTTTRANWYICGDEEGEYVFSADVAGTWVSGDITSPFQETFTLKDPLRVYAGSALHLDIECEDYAERGEEYKVKYRLTNVSDKTLYNLTFRISGIEQYRVRRFHYGETVVEDADILDSIYLDGELCRSITEMRPGGYIEMELGVTCWFNSSAEGVEFATDKILEHKVPVFGSFLADTINVVYDLTGVNMVTLEGSTTTIPYSVKINQKERKDLVNVLVHSIVDETLKESLEDIPQGSLGEVFIDVVGESLDANIVAVETAKGILELQQGTTNYNFTITVDDGSGIPGGIETEKLIIHAGDDVEGLIDTLNGTQFTVKSGKIGLEVKAPGSSKFEISVKDENGKLVRTYNMNVETIDGRMITRFPMPISSPKARASSGFHLTETSVDTSGKTLDTVLKEQLNREMEVFRKNPLFAFDSRQILDLSATPAPNGFDYDLTVDTAALTRIDQNTATTDFTLDNGASQVDLSLTAMKDLAAAGGDSFTFRVAREETAYTITAAAASGKSLNLPEPMTLTLPYAIPEEGKAEDVVVQYTDAAGNLVELAPAYEEGKVTFEAPVFGTYTVTQKKKANLCGEDLTWKLEEGILTIEGTGAMTDFSAETPAPWAAAADQIHTLVVREETTALGANAFSSCAKLKTVQLPLSLTKIGKNAFAGCKALETVYYGGFLPDWQKVTIGSGNEALTCRNVIFPVHDHVWETQEIPYRAPEETQPGNEGYKVSVCAKCGLWGNDQGQPMTEEEKEAYKLQYALYVKATGVTMVTQQRQVDLYAGNTFQLTAAAQPAGAKQVFVWSTGSKSVATVDENGLVTFLKPGTVKITAKTTDGSNKKITISLQSYYRDTAKKFTAAAAPETLLYKADSRKGLQVGDSLQLQVFGTDKTRALEDMTFTLLSGDKYAEVTADGVVTAKKAGGSAKIQASWTGDPMKRKVTISIKTIATLPTQILLEPQGDSAKRAADGYLLHDGWEQTGEDLVLAAKVGAQRTFALKAVGRDSVGQTFSLAGAIQWSVSGKGASVKEAKDGTVTVTVKKNASGIATVRATSRQDKTLVRTFTVDLRDHAPKLAAKKLTMNTFLAEAATDLLVTDAANTVSSLKIWEQQKNKTYKNITGSGDFVLKQEGILWKIDTRDQKGILNNGSRKLKITGTTAHEGDFEIPLTLTIKNTAPKVTVKQTRKLNLSAMDRYAAVQVTAKGETIDSIALSSDMGYTVTEKNGDSYTILLTGDVKAVKGTMTFVSQKYRHIPEKSFKLATENKVPTITMNSYLTDAGCTMPLIRSAGSNGDKISLGLYNKKEKGYQPTEELEALFTGGNVTIRPKGAARTLKNGTYQLQVTVGSDVYSLILKVKNTAPSLTVKQLTKLDLKNSASVAKMTVTAKDGSAVTDIAFADMAVRKVSGSNGTFTIGFVKEGFQGNKTDLSGSLQATVAGYRYVPLKKLSIAGKR